MHADKCSQKGGRIIRSVQAESTRGQTNQVRSTVRYSLIIRVCIVGWVNLYKKFEIDKKIVCGKLILPKKWKEMF